MNVHSCTMRPTAFIIIIGFSLVFIENSALPNNFLNILSQVKDHFQLDLFVTVFTQNLPTSNQMLQHLHDSLSVQVIHFSNSWHPPRNVNSSRRGRFVLEKFKRNLLLIAIIDGVATRDALLMQVFGLTYRNPMAKVIFFVTENSSMRAIVLKALIRKCFDWDLINVVFVQHGDPLETFTYHPFNNFQIIKLSKTSDFFANRFKNLNNYPFKALIYDAPPRVMKSKEGEQICGYGGHLIASYIQKRNGTTKIIPRRDEMSIYLDALDHFVTRKLDMIFGLFPMLHSFIGDQSYPALYEKFCVMVPAPKIIPVYRNFIQPFEQNVWIAIICGIFYMTIVTYAIDATVNGRKDMSASLISSICFVINRGEIGIFSNVNRRLFVIYLLLFLLGFVLSNMYCALLTTFLTSPSYERGIETLADIAAKGLKIVGEEMEVLYITNQDIYKKFHPFLRKLSAAEYFKMRSTLNNTNAAIIPTDAFEFLNEMQKYQNNIKFKIADMCTLDLYLSVTLKHESIFLQDINSHILLVQQAGLLSYWKANSFFEALRTGYLHLKRGTMETGPIQLKLAHLLISFYVLLSGLLISTSAFLAEKLYYYIVKNVVK